MTTKARLEGHEFDLQDLAEWLPAGDIHVAKDDEGYYLEASLIDNPPDGKTFYEAAQDVMKLVNGLGRVKTPTFRVVRLTGHYQDGDQRHVVVQPDSVVVRSRVSTVVITVDGEVNAPPPPPGPQYLTTATTHDDVGEVLKIMSQPNPLGWVELYKVYEIVRAAGALGQARTAAGLEEAELVLFRRTANHPQASGTDGRHARSAEQPPTKPMDVAQARQIISRLVQAWMDTI